MSCDTTQASQFCRRRKRAVRGVSPRGAAFAAALAGLAACQSAPPAGPEGGWSALPASQSRLSLTVPDLASESRHARFASADGRYVEETARWGGDDPGQPRAGLRISEASPGPPLTDPPGAAAIIPGWTALHDKRPAIGEPATEQNALGPVTWWRASLGTSVCVLFVQRPASKPPAASTLSGFYCNPQGLPLSAQAAVQVVQGIGLRPRPEGQ